MTVVPDSLAVVDPVANRIVYDIKPLGEGPGPIGVGDDGLWILSLNSKTLASVDPRTRELRSTQGIGGTPTNMAVGGREVWISDSCNSNTNPALIRYEHGLPENIEEVSLPPASGEAKPTQTVACGLAASGESVWAGLTAPASIVHASVDPALNLAKTVDVVPLAGQANAIGLGEGAVWVARLPEQHRSANRSEEWEGHGQHSGRVRPNRHQCRRGCSLGCKPERRFRFADRPADELGDQGDLGRCGTELSRRRRGGSMGRERRRRNDLPYRLAGERRLEHHLGGPSSSRHCRSERLRLGDRAALAVSVATSCHACEVASASMMRTGIGPASLRERRALAAYGRARIRPVSTSPHGSPRGLSNLPN